MTSAIRSSKLARPYSYSMRLLPLLVSMVCGINAQAASIGLAEQNGAGLGNSFAGGGAVAEDASTVWFNPAGMTYLPQGHSIAVGGTFLDLSSKFSDKGSSRVNGLIPLGDNGGNAGGNSVIPVGYYSYAMSPQLRFGIGISPSFGNKTEYDSNFMGRYQGTYSKIEGINVNPSVAFKVNDMVSLGFGLDYLNFSAELRSKAPVVVLAPGPTYLGDANVKLKGEDRAWGYNLGALFQLSPTTRVGLTYRSNIKVKIASTLEISSAFAATSSQSTTVPIKLPDMWSVSVFQTLDDKWEMMGDITRTGWSTIPSLDVINAAGTTISSEPLNFKNTWRVGLGANYKLDSQLKLRFGVAYDKTPVPDEASRTVRLPDADRTWISAGAQWRLNKTSTVDVGYTHLFFKDSNINRRTVLNGNATAQTVFGGYKTNANLFSAQYSASF